MFELKPDYEKVLERFEAWWDGKVIDRALAYIVYPKAPNECVPVPKKHHASIRDRWLDTEYVVENTVAELKNTGFVADALPIAWPNLGPEVFSAFYGCELEYGERTAWSKPCLKNWDDETLANFKLDKNNFYYKKLLEMTNAFLEAGKGKFIVGYTDTHPGGDAITAFRDPQELCIDVLEYPEQIIKLANKVTDDFIEFYDFYHNKLSAAGMPSACFLPAICKGKYHIPSCDFSALISEEMYETLFLPSIVRECNHMNRSIYHLDGQKALRHLDKILEVPSIHAIQWQPGVQHMQWKRWVDVYKKILAAKKSLILYVSDPKELPDLFKTFKPEGIWISCGVNTKEEADYVLKAITNWKA